MGRCTLRSPLRRLWRVDVHPSPFSLLGIHFMVFLHTQGEFPALVGLLAFCITRGIVTASMASGRRMCGAEE